MGGGRGGVRPPPPIEMPDASFANLVMQTVWRTEEKTEKTLGKECDGRKW